MSCEAERQQNFPAFLLRTSKRTHCCRPPALHCEIVLAGLHHEGGAGHSVVRLRVIGVLHQDEGSDLHFTAGKTIAYSAVVSEQEIVKSRKWIFFDFPLGILIFQGYFKQCNFMLMQQQQLHFIFSQSVFPLQQSHVNSAFCYCC